MLHIAVISPVAKDVVLLHSNAPRRLRPTLILVPVRVSVVLPRSLPFTLRAVIASNLPQLFEKLVIDFEVLRVWFGVIFEIAVCGIVFNLLGFLFSFLFGRVRVSGVRIVPDVDV